MLHSSKLLLLKFHFLKARLWSRTCDILLGGLKEMFLLSIDDNDIFLYSFTVVYCKNLLCMSMHSFTTIAVNKHIWTTVFALGSMNKHFSLYLIFLVFCGLFCIGEWHDDTANATNATFWKWRQCSAASQKRPKHFAFIYVKTKTDEMTAVFISCDL